MSSIVGLVSKVGTDVAPLLRAMLERTPHREQDRTGVALGLKVKCADDASDPALEGLSGPLGLGHSGSETTRATETQPLIGCGRGLVATLNGGIWDRELLREQCEAYDHIFTTDSDCEVLVHQLEDQLVERGDLAEAAETLVRELDGEYAFAVYDGIQDEFVLGRDIVGIQPLYYGETHDFLAFSSEKRPLWNLSIRPRSVLPGQVVKLAGGSSDEWRLSPGERLELSQPSAKSETSDERVAIGSYWAALIDAVRKRIDGYLRIGVLFTGRVDSVLVARIAQRLGVDVRCYTSGVPRSNGVELSRSAANALGLPLGVFELDANIIRSEIPDIVTAIESTDPYDVDYALPIYFAARGAVRDGIRVMLTGLGADELFAGHPRYGQILARSGNEGLREALWSDLSSLHEDTLERVNKITTFHGVELRVPYLDPGMIGAAMQIAPSLKIQGGRLKYLHRRLAEGVGIPHSIAWRPEDGEQGLTHVHGISKADLDRLDRKFVPPQDEWEHRDPHRPREGENE